MKRFNLKAGVKPVALCMAAVLSIGVLAGCGGKGTDKDDQGRTIVTVGTWPTNEKEIANMNARKDRFEEANPDFVIQGDQWTFDLKSFYAKAAGKQLPTVFNTNFTEVPMAASAGYLADLTSELKKQGIYDKLNEDVLKVITKDDKVYAFPHTAYVLGLAYNVSDFRKAGLLNEDGTPMQPKTWDELAEFAVKLKEATGHAAFVFPSAENVGGWQFTQIAWSYGATFMEQDKDGKWHATFATPECTEALQWLKDMKWKYKVMPENSFVNAEELYKIYGTGKASMVIGSQATTTYANQYQMDVNDIGLMAIPAGPKKHVSLMGGGVYSVPEWATEKQIEGALKWIQMTSTPDATEEYKTNIEKSYELMKERGQLTTLKSLSPWNTKSTAVQFVDQMIEKYGNADIANVKLYNDFVTDMGDCELKAEEPVCAQELYSILDSCIQAVLTDENADCAELLKKAAFDFQANYLDNLDY